MGAFAAATYKRGITFINVPTTLLGAVDASVGGKTGVNLGVLKNEVGVFRQADCVIVSTLFFNTLTSEELRSGYAEMLKHALLNDKSSFDRLIERHVEDFDADTLLGLLEKSVLIKKDIVDSDPEEKGLRKSLNLGHTVGHAFESLALERKSPLPHGYAVAYGLVTELVLSKLTLSFPSDLLHKFAAYVKEVYPGFYFSCDDYPRLIALMRHDKKNSSTADINFTLLENVGEVRIDCVIGEEEIKNALDITRDLLGI
jgi:3-dehydroquinate synthase